MSGVRVGVPDCCGTGRGQHMVNESVAFLVRETRLVNPLCKSLGLVAMDGVWKFLIFCCAAYCLRRCPGSRVMSEYGVFASVSGGVPTLGSLAGTGQAGIGTGLSVDWS